jgi:methylated-DNA-[protein]-cysteine S-methyltransferase
MTLDSELKKAAKADVGPHVDRFAELAAAKGHADLAYTEHDSPLGRLLLVTSKRGVLRVSYYSHDAELEELAHRISPRIVRAPGALDEVRRELDEYFEGERKAFDVPIDLQISGPFVAKILRATARIPYGKVISYRDVARRAGNERAVRAAGNALGSNPIPIIVPCHRVVRTGGSLGGYTGGLEKKEFLLHLEGAL